jgi:hypothetical protein
VANSDRFTFNQVNPASYADLQEVTFEFSGNISRTTLSDATRTNTLTGGGLQNIGFGFPGRKPFAVAFGLVPYSTVGYGIVRNTPQVAPDSSTYTIRDDRNGQGGVNEFFFGGSVKFFRRLSVGVNASYKWGRLQGSELVESTNDNGYFSDILFRNDYRIRSWAVRGGLIYTDTLQRRAPRVPDTTGLDTTAAAIRLQEYNTRYAEWERNRRRNAWVVRGGAVATTLLSGKYDYTNELVYFAPGTGSVVFDTSSTLNDAALNIPLEWGVGFSVSRGYGLTLTAEAMLQNWEGFSMAGKTTSTFGQATRYAGGVEWIPNPENLRGYWNRIALRAGGYVQQTGWVVEGTDIAGWGVTAGLGIPVFRVKSRTDILSRINLSAEYGSRGTTANGLVQETGWRFVFGVSMLQPWFRVWRYE